VRLNARAFGIAQETGDRQGEIRQKSLEGVGLLEQNRYDEAMIRFEDALEFANSEPDVRFPLMAYMGKAQALAAQGHEKESGELLRRAMEYVDSANMQVYKADLLLALANRAIAQKRKTEAETLLARAATSAKRAGMPRPYADAELRMTKLYMKRGELRQAEEAIKKCILASRQLADMYFLPQHLALAGEIETRLGHSRQAEADYEEAEAEIESMLLNVPSAAVKASLIATMDDVFRGHFELAAKKNQISMAFRILENVRGRIISDNLRARPQAPMSANANPAIKALNRIQGRLLRTTDVAARARLVDQLEHIEERNDLTALSRNRARFSIHGRPVDIPSLQRWLRSDEAVIEYVMDDPASQCLVITDKSVAHYTLPGRTLVEKDIGNYLQAISATRDDKSAATLYQDLFAPIRELASKRELVIVPDGKLGFIPFESLIDGNERYVIETHSISYVPSATVLYLLRSFKRPHAPVPLLALGNSNEASPKGVSFGRAAHGLFDVNKPVQFHAIPAVDSEVHEIGEIVGKGAEVLAGNTDAHPTTGIEYGRGVASEASFKDHRLKDYRIIHIAAHGFADPKFPERSGLFLGFDQVRREDGLLQVREIRDLRLNAELVTLSACDTGAGKLEGQNGVASIVQAFLFAGARSVVASLWTADDVFTAELMTRFYANLAAGQSVAAALRGAKLDMIHEFGPRVVPLLWAGLFVSGDPSISISFKNANTHYGRIN
jgi:CHAT domain-containing protein/Tfp pilus assembly protein PilF